MIRSGSDPCAGASTLADYLDRVALTRDPATHRDAEPTINFLIAHGVDPSAPDSFSALCHYGFFERVQIALEAGARLNSRGQHDRPLVAAARQGHLELVCLLLQNGADPNLLSAAGLSAVAEAKSSEIVRMLVEYGASLEIHHPDGSSPLTHAARSLGPERVQLLLELGANPNQRALDGTSAHDAARHQYDDASRVVILGLLRMSGAR